MSADLRPDEEPEAPRGRSAAQDVQPKGRRRSFGAVRRELSEKELASPGTQKMLLDEIERLDGELSEARAYVEKFHEADKQVGKLEQKLKTHSEPHRVCRGLQLLSRMEHDQQDDEQVFI